MHYKKTSVTGKQEVEAKIRKGLRQRCGLSPLLFNIYIEETMITLFIFRIKQLQDKNKLETV